MFIAARGPAVYTEVMTSRTIGLGFALALAALGVGACASKKPEQPKGVYLPDGVPQTAENTAPEDSQRQLVDGIVGQVNGQPVYVGTVIDPDLSETLKRLGEELPRLAFRQQAVVLIHDKLQSIIDRRLMLGEAERNLTAQEEQGLRHYLADEERAKLIAEQGGGVLIIAEQNLMQREGLTIDQKLEERRQDEIVKMHITREILPKISISRRDMERYYEENIEQFRPRAGRVMRVIRTDNPSDADEIDRLLAEGTAFEEVAGMQVNRYRRDDGGLHSDKPLAGDEPFSIDELNQALPALKAGEHSPRIAVGDGFFWVYVESITDEKGKTFQEAQSEIALLLRNQQYEAMYRQYYAELRRTGPTDPIEIMMIPVVEAAMNRYAKPQ